MAKSTEVHFTINQVKNAFIEAKRTDYSHRNEAKEYRTNQACNLMDTISNLWVHDLIDRSFLDEVQDYYYEQLDKDFLNFLTEQNI